MVPLPDEERGQVPVAFIVPREAGEGAGLGVDEVKRFAIANGPAYQHPRRVAFLPELPWAGTNKIDRRALWTVLASLRPRGPGPPDMRHHAGRVALVTGASRGIGRAIARRLAAEGAFVLVHYNRDATAAEQTLALIREAGGQGSPFRPISASWTEPRPWRMRLAVLRRDLADPFLDILVNNAGVSEAARFLETTPEAFDRIVTVNLRAPFFLTQKLLPHIRDGGRIINVSSMGVRAPQPHMAAYAPVKAGLEVLPASLRRRPGHAASPSTPSRRVRRPPT